MWTYVSAHEMYHHGIKGQKWGIRRFQEEDGDLTPAGKERYANQRKERKQETPEERKKRIQRNVIIGATVATAAIAAIGYMRYKKNAKILDSKALSAIQPLNTKRIDVNSLSDKDVILPKGTKFQRISSRSLEDYTKSGKQIYASYLKSDNAIYMNDMPKNIDRWRKNGTIKDDGKSVYKHMLEMNKDVKVASPKKVVEVYKNVTGDTECKQYRYQNFITGLVDRDKVENKKFISKLVDMGYNAIVDENDAGVYTKSPLILLDPANDVLGVSTTKLKKIHKVLNILMYR